jgi:hypothetical protein
MARFGVNILMRTAFRNGIQHFGNTHYYDDPLGTPALSTLEALVDDIVAKYKSKHSSNITFVRGRLWSQIGTPSQNQMLVDKPLTGTGSAAPISGLDRERAYLIRFRAGVDSRGRPVYLRKWWHLDANIGGGSVGATQQSQQGELDAATRAGVEALGESIKQIAVGTPTHTFNLVSKGGRVIDGATNAHRWLEHHQFGEEWRGA